MYIYTHCWWKKSCTSWELVYPIIYEVSYMAGGAGFLPSTDGMSFSCVLMVISRVQWAWRVIYIYMIYIWLHMIHKHCLFGKDTNQNNFQRCTDDPHNNDALHCEKHCKLNRLKQSSYESDDFFSIWALDRIWYSRDHEIVHFGGIQQCKSMANSRVFHPIPFPP